MLTKNLTQAQITEGLQSILKDNKKQRKFVETVELQIGLKDYDP